MKYLFIVLLVLLSFTASANVNEPPANAFTWEITSGGDNGKDYELAMFVGDVFPPNQMGLRVVYRNAAGGEWLYLIMPTITTFEPDGTADEQINEALIEINKKVVTYFRLDEVTDLPEPETLKEYLELVVMTKISWDSNANSLIYNL